MHKFMDEMCFEAGMMAHNDTTTRVITDLKQKIIQTYYCAGVSVAHQITQEL